MNKDFDDFKKLLCNKDEMEKLAHSVANKDGIVETNGATMILICLELLERYHQCITA